jgi:hypothetical protein
MYPTGFKSFIIILALMHFFAGNHVLAQNKLTMQPYYEVAGEGTDIWAAGDSFIVPKGSLKHESEVFLEAFTNIRKIFLVWSGEVKDYKERFQQILLTPVGKKTVRVKADAAYRSGSSGLIYSCVADITRHYNGRGDYSIKGLKSDALNGSTKSDLYSVAGFAIVVIYDKLQGVNHRVQIYAGLDVLRPGEIHDISILNKGSGRSLIKMAVVGGHGRKGNGSSNLLNGISISQSEDWDGSSGHYWDVDVFETIDVDRTEAEKKGLIFSIDTVLQWLYPVVIATVYKEGN